jgi:hypothetical protein
MTTYRIPNWDDDFENNKSRPRENCRYVLLPNKQDGMGLTRILALKDGAAIYGIWCLIVGMVSRQRTPRAGWLTETGHPSGTPLAPDDLALRWRRPVAEVRRALEILSSNQVGWLQVPGGCPDGAEQVPDQCREGASEEKRIEEKRTEGKYSVKAKEVFDHWVSVMGKQASTKFPSTSKRYINVVARLKEGFSVDDLKRAVDGCKATPHNMGQNDRGETYNDLELICRNVENVERFMRNAKSPPRPKQKNAPLPGSLGAAPSADATYVEIDRGKGIDRCKREGVGWGDLSAEELIAIGRGGPLPGGAE